MTQKISLTFNLDDRQLDAVQAKAEKLVAPLFNFAKKNPCKRLVLRLNYS